MSWRRLPPWVIDFDLGPRHSGSARLLIRLWSYVEGEADGEDAFVYPSIGTLAQRANCPRRTIEDQISVLTKCGALTRATDCEGHLGWMLRWNPIATADRGRTTRPTVDKDNTADRGSTLDRGHDPHSTVVRSTVECVGLPPSTVDGTLTGTTEEQHTDQTRVSQNRASSSLLPIDGMIRYLGNTDSTHLLAMAATWCSAFREAVDEVGLDLADVRYVVERHEALTKAAKADGSLARLLREEQLPALRSIWSRFSKTRQWLLGIVEDGRATRRVDAGEMGESPPPRDEPSVQAFEAALRGEAGAARG